MSARDEDTAANVAGVVQSVWSRLHHDGASRFGKTSGYSLLVTSSRQRDGKSVVARMLAQEFARASGLDVLLADGNFAHPTLHREFGLPLEQGFSDALIDVPHDAVELHEVSAPGLKVLTAGSRPNAQLLVRTSAIERLLTRLGERFALMVIDGPSIPVGGRSMAQATDAVVYVVDATSTRSEVAQGALGAAALDPSKLLGVVLNKRVAPIPRFLYRHL